MSTAAPRTLKLFAHAGPHPRALFVVERGERALKPLTRLPSSPRDAAAPIAWLDVARARTELGLCARCEHLLGSSSRVAIDLERELVYCLDCWAVVVAAVKGKDPLP